MKEILDEDAKRWLEQHAHELGPEEILFEEEKLEAEKIRLSGRWPVPSKMIGMGIFDQIKDETTFNRIIGDPTNWERILGWKDLYHLWIKPQAILIFGKGWFDRVKWKGSIQKMAPFPLFSESERALARQMEVPLEETNAGKSKILRISSRVEHALEMYLTGGGRAHSGRIKRPGGYIVDSIKNEFVQEIGTDMGYRLVQVPVCPLCLVTNRKEKRGGLKKRTVIPLDKVESGVYSCNRCSQAHVNLKLCITSENTREDEKRWARGYVRKTASFMRFEGVTCVCPSPKCSGKFVPLRSIKDPNWWETSHGIKADKAIKNLRVYKGTQRFRDPPKELMSLPLSCPYCDEKFTPGEALKKASGFKKQSGKLTGVPLAAVWRQKEEYTLDHRACDVSNGHFQMVNMRESIADKPHDPLENIIHKKRIEILVGETLLELTKSPAQTVPSFMSKCFYLAVIRWMTRYPTDASKYFFGWSVGERDLTIKEREHFPGRTKKRVVDVLRGQETAIHQEIFHLWMKILSDKMSQIRKIPGSKIRRLSDIKWLCRPPKYNKGPKVSFTSFVDSDLIVTNTGSIEPKDFKAPRPRIAWVLSLRKEGKGPNLSSKISSCEWQSFKISSKAGLVEGDQVKVEALMMPGHHCHAPIKRITRLRTDLFAPIIERIKNEEENGSSDTIFWNDRKDRVRAARQTLRGEIEEFL